MNFDHAIYISTQSERDFLQLTIIDPVVLRSEKTKQFVPKYFKTDKLIPAQLPNNLGTDILDYLTKVFDIGSKSSLVANFFANLAISGSLNYLWGMINCL